MTEYENLTRPNVRRMEESDIDPEITAERYRKRIRAEKAAAIPSHRYLPVDAGIDESGFCLFYFFVKVRISYNEKNTMY